MKLFQILFIVLLFSSCQEEEKCKFKITPIFKSPTSTITNHSFDHHGKKATEKATFPNGVRLELFQTICNDSQQEFHFYIKGDYRNRPDEFWVKEAAQQFYNMASTSKDVEGVSMWGVVLERDLKMFPLGEKVGVDEGISVIIDKLVGIDESQVIITTSQVYQ